MDKARREKDRASGSLGTIKQELREEFGCSTLKEAKNKLAELEQQQEEEEEKYQRKLEAFEKEFGDLLE